jgi:ubiquinone/menaquinone biosynthesis C-methylase UbiE
MSNGSAARIEPPPITLGHVAQAQERIGALLAQVTMRQAWLDHTGIADGHRVLEVGSGTGVVTRELARRVGPFGKVIAIEPSEALRQAAVRLATREDLQGRIEFLLGEAADLELPPHSADHAVVSLVFQHLADPKTALRQIRRVLRPGGGIAAFEQDLESLAVDHPDRSLTRVILQHAAEHYVLCADAAKRLPGLYTEVGFVEVEVLTFLQAERSEDGLLFDLVVRFAALAAAQGRVRPEAASDWVGTLRRKTAEGTFFASLPHYAVLAKKPLFGS